MDAFSRHDHPGVLACLTDGVEWILPGTFHRQGKMAFDKEIENDAFIGKPAITVTRMTEENDVVIAEGSVRCQRKDGAMLTLVFCDVFEMAGGKIRKLTSFLHELMDASSA
jgi:ketosteroid isomerase-like protein